LLIVGLVIISLLSEFCGLLM